MSEGDLAKTSDDGLITSDESSLINIEGFNPEDVRKCSDAAKRLIAQGEHFHHRDSGTKMILFTGMSGDNLVDIQVQGGDKLRQLIVVAIDMDSAEGMELYINLQDPERTKHPHLPEKVQKFMKGQVSQKVMNLIHKSPVYTGQAVFNNPTTSQDLKNLTQILENTKIDRELLQKVVDHDKVDEYVYEGAEEPKKSLGSKIIGLLTRNN